MEMKCDMCLERKEVRHIPLYVMGSEGIWICVKCDGKLRALVVDTRVNALRKRMYNRPTRDKEV